MRTPSCTESTRICVDEILLSVSNDFHGMKIRYRKGSLWRRRRCPQCVRPGRRAFRHGVPAPAEGAAWRIHIEPAQHLPSLWALAVEESSPALLDGV